MLEALFAVALLACPLVMGAMMWMMTRRGKAQPGDADGKRAELARLEAQIDQLRAGQADPSRTEPGAVSAR